MNDDKPRFWAAKPIPWLWLLGAVFFVSAPSEGQIWQSQTAHLIEGTFLKINLPELFPEDVDPGSIMISTPARHGSLSATESREVHYFPDPDYFGFDAITFEGSLSGKSGRTTVTVSLRLRVLPRVLPIGGVFDDSFDGAAGFYYLEEKQFFLCEPWALHGVMQLSQQTSSTQDARTLTCHSYPVPEAGIGWLPVVGDWEGDRHDLRPSLFDPTTGTVHRLKLSPSQDQLHIAASVQLANATWAWPLAGDWLGSGADQLALYDDDGTVRTVEDLFSATKEPTTVTWPGGLRHSADQDALPWPFFARQAGAGVLAIFDGSLWRWLASDGITGEIEYLQQFSGIPVYYDQWGYGTSGLLSFRRDGDTLWLEEWDHIDPQTIALKFHNDPPDP